MEINYQHIFQFGNQIALLQSIDETKLHKQLEQFDDKWTQYNEFKPFINRQGLCLLNDDGINKAGPALSSLREWNIEHGTDYDELDFNVATPVLDACTELKEVLEPILPYCYRTHFLRLGPGGYFPPHRDNLRPDANSFRLIMPIKNTANPHCRFMLEDKPLYMNLGQLYAINTTLEHTLFNAGFKDSIWLVVNVKLDIETYKFVVHNLSVS